MSSTDSSAGPDLPTAEQTISLFQSIESIFPHTTLGVDKWYLVVISALTFLEPSHAATLYTYLLSKPEYATSEARKTLMRRLREALVENVSIVGVCKPLESIFAIIGVEREEDRDYSFSREHWQSGPTNLARGESWLRQIYQHNLEPIISQFAAHKDFDFITREISYGFYLSDMSILGPVETELVVLSGIMVQDLRLETEWHVRGLRRVGVSKEDVKIVMRCVEMVVDWAGGRLRRVKGVEVGDDEEVAKA